RLPGACTLSRQARAWIASPHFAPCVTILLKLLWIKSYPNPTFTSRRGCASDITLPVRTTWCASFLVSSNPRTTLATILTLAPHSSFVGGGDRASSFRILNHPFTFTRNASRFRGRRLNRNGEVSSPLERSRTTPPGWCSATSRPWRSRKQIAWSCFEPLAPILGRSLCCTATRRLRLSGRCQRRLVP